MKYVLCFGNPFLKGDSLAQKAGKKIRIEGVRFVSCNSAEEIMFYLDKDFVILDVAKGIKKARIISDASMLDTGKIVSLHDFDLAFFLKVMKKLGGRKKVRIIALPEKMKLEDAEREVKRILSLVF
jgi:Ni,Fe-hydrogenase maturation factor